MQPAHRGRRLRVLHDPVVTRRAPAVPLVRDPVASAVPVQAPAVLAGQVAHALVARVVRVRVAPVAAPAVLAVAPTGNVARHARRAVLVVVAQI